MQGLSCITSTTHGLGIIVVKGLMCLCQICAALLLIFYFFTNYWQVGSPASVFINLLLLDWNAISLHFIYAVSH